MIALPAVRRVVPRCCNASCLQRSSSGLKPSEQTGQTYSTVNPSMSRSFGNKACSKAGQRLARKQGLSRSYATARPNPPLRKGASDPWLQFVADMARCPTLPLEEVQNFLKQASPLEYGSDALVYTNCAEEYLNALRSGARHPNVDLTDRPDIDAAVICETATILIRQPERYRLGLGMFIAAASLDYHPAIINLALTMSRDKRWRASPMSTPYESKFQSLVRLGKDPNALAVDGRRKMIDEDFTGAQKSFQKALAIGGEDWSMESATNLWLGQILRKQGSTAEAQEYLQKCVEINGIDRYRAEFEQAEISLHTSEEEATQKFYASGLYGFVDGYGRLADIELAKAGETLDQDKAANHRAWAMEWKRLQDYGK